MSSNAGGLKKYFLVLYVGMWIVILTSAIVWLTAFLVGTLRDPLAKKKANTPNLDVFDSVVALTEKRVVGPTPHSKAPQQRAFLNMHNLFISCQVCHVQEQEGVAPTRFGWIDITNGQLRSNPEMAEGVWGEYGAKIVQLKGTEQNPQPVSLDEEEAFAATFRKRVDSLDDRQKVIGNKFIHRRCVSTPVRCSDCHNSEKAFLPYTALGYSSERSDFLVSSEVVDLVGRYETFYMPNLLKADEQMQTETGEKPQ
jgi:hypothetical protein